MKSIDRFFIFWACFSLIVNSCGNPNKVKKRRTDVFIFRDKVFFYKNISERNKKEVFLRNHTDSVFSLLGLVPVQKVNSGILVDLKYGSEDNFMQEKLYDTIQTAYLAKEVAFRLSKVQETLSKIKPGYRLLIYDAVRPLSVQIKMWKTLDSVPVSLRGKMVSNPNRGSVHNFGAAVDVTIVDEKGNPLDMGANYDDFRKISYPSLESYFLQKGNLSVSQIENRKLLREVMNSQKFRNIPTEWWHFNAYSRIKASRKFKKILDESARYIYQPLPYEKLDSLK